MDIARAKHTSLGSANQKDTQLTQLLGSLNENDTTGNSFSGSQLLDWGGQCWDKLGEACVILFVKPSHGSDDFGGTHQPQCVWLVSSLLGWFPVDLTCP